MNYDWTGRQIKEKSAINKKLPCILKHLGIETQNWITLTTAFEYKFKYFAGDANAFPEAKQTMARARMPSVISGKALFGGID